MRLTNDCYLYPKTSLSCLDPLDYVTNCVTISTWERHLLYNLLPPVRRPKYDTDHSPLTSIDVWTQACGTGSNKAVSGQSMVLNFTVWLEAGVSRMASLLTDVLILRILYSSSTHFVPQKVMLRKVANFLQVFWHNLENTFLKLTIMLIVLFWLLVTFSNSKLNPLFFNHLIPFDLNFSRIDKKRN